MLTTVGTSAAETHSLTSVERWTAALHRLGAFQGADDNNPNDPVVWEAATDVEAAAEHVVAEPVHVTEDFMALCMELLEEQLPVSSRGTKAVLTLLANLCLTDENRSLASNFGLPGTCVLLLQRHKELSAETLYYVFDLMSTMAASDGNARQNLRPAIPHVLASMQSHGTALEVLFGASFLLSTLVMLDTANCDVIVERGGVQVLVNIFRAAENALHGQRGPQRKGGSVMGGAQRPTSAPKAALGPLANALQAQKQAERTQLCEGAMRWSRDALVTVCRSASSKGDLAQCLATTDFGVFGASVAVDELKWNVLSEQKKRKKSASTDANGSTR